MPWTEAVLFFGLGSFSFFLFLLLFFIFLTFMERLGGFAHLWHLSAGCGNERCYRGTPRSGQLGKGARNAYASNGQNFVHDDESHDEDDGGLR